MSWWDYVRRITNDAPQMDIAAASGVAAATISRWSTGQRGVTLDSAVAIARGYRRPVLEALVAAGLITGEDARETPAAAPSLSSLSDDDLLAEVRKRMRHEAQKPGQEASGEIHGGTGRPPPIEQLARDRAGRIIGERVKPRRTRRASGA